MYRSITYQVLLYMCVHHNSLLRCCRQIRTNAPSVLIGIIGFATRVQSYIHSAQFPQSSKAYESLRLYLENYIIAGVATVCAITLLRARLRFFFLPAHTYMRSTLLPLLLFLVLLKFVLTSLLIILCSNVRFLAATSLSFEVYQTKLNVDMSAFLLRSAWQ